MLDTPQIDDVILWVGAVLGALVVISSALVGLHRAILRGVTRRLDKVEGLLVPNGGTSVRDAIDRIAERQKLIAIDVSRTAERLDDHISFHLEEQAR